MKSTKFKFSPKKTGYVILGIFLFFMVFCIYLNYQDLNALEVKNSSRRKIESKYDDKKIEESRDKFFLYRQNKKLKGYRGKFLKKSNLLDVSGMKKNIKDYKKKLKKNKKDKKN